MIFNFLLIVIFGQITTLLSLLSNDFCRINQKECIGSYDSLNKYIINCTNIKCNGKYKYQCGQDICSTNQLNCDVYLRLIKVINTYGAFYNEYVASQTVSSNYFIIRKNKLKNFNNKIAKCALVKYKFNSNDFCLNGKNCIERKKIYKSRRIDYTTNKINCKCSNRLSFHCGHYCTSNNISCDYLKAINHTSISFLNQTCSNDHKMNVKYVTPKYFIDY